MHERDAAAPLRPRVPAGADQALSSRSEVIARPAQRQRHRPVAVRGPERRSRRRRLAREREKSATAISLPSLPRGAPRSARSPYRVTLVGRWSEVDARARSRDEKRRSPETQRTPLAARADRRSTSRTRPARSRIELADRRRAVATRSARAKAATSSSTAFMQPPALRNAGSRTARGGWPMRARPNGIRIESTSGVIDALSARRAAPRARLPIELASRHVRSCSVARTRGEPGQYPRLSLHLPRGPGAVAGRGNARESAWRRR